MLGGRQNRPFKERLYAKKKDTALFSRLCIALFVTLFLCLYLLCPASLPASPKGPTVKLGVLAHKGRDVALRMWEPTASYLQKNIPGSSFQIIPLDFAEVDNAVAAHAVDFVIANSSIYVGLEAKYGVARIATMKNRTFRGSSTVFGGTIFCRAARGDIKTLADVKGKTFLAVDETSLGGWQAAWREFHDAGVDPYRDFKGLSFVNNHESVVMAVKSGKADVGTVRTDTLERMAEKGMVSLQEFLVINSRKEDDFPFLLSTRLYPEWPMARLEKTPEETAKRVAVALLNMPSNSDAAVASDTHGWTIPRDYHAVHDLMKELRIGPYRDYGKFTFGQSVRQYWHVPLLFVLALAIMSLVLWHILKLNRHILTAKKQAEEARNSLEQQVIARTADLQAANEELRHEVEMRKESEQKLFLAEQERAEQLLFLQSVIDSIADPVMVLSPDYRVRLINRAAKKISDDNTFCYHISHRADSPCSDMDHPCPLRTVLDTKKPVMVVHTHAGPQGEDVIVEITASPIFDSAGNVAYVIEVCRDISDRVRQETEQKRADQRLFYMQKEKSIATLAGGIAHDFNNILMGVLGHAELLKMRFSLKPAESAPVDSIIEGVERMADLTRQLLAYAKEGKYQLKHIFLQSVIRKALDLSHKGKAKATRIVLSLPDDLWPVKADEHQLIQAFVNLCRNAFEAVEEGGGTLAISAENLVLTESRPCSCRHEHPVGDYLSISVADTGGGIPASIADRVFEPFVTSKFIGRGLGLPATLGIIQNHGGCITFSSEAGKGTTFHILLPRAGEPAPETSVKTLPAPSAQDCILIVDDEPDILQLLEAFLVRSDYEVIAADTGDKALEAFRSSADRIEVVILDLQLPGMSGAETFRNIKLIKPEIKIIVSTGYDRDMVMEEVRPFIPDGFIQKPYKLQELRETLQQVLLFRP